MKRINLTLFMIAFYLSNLSAQHPSNDLNWQLIPSLSEEFNGPLSSIWRNDMWWVNEFEPDASKDYYCTLDNLQISGGVGNFYLKKDNKYVEWYITDPDDASKRIHKDKTFPYTFANISTGKTGKRYNYGYFESRVKLPAYSRDGCLGYKIMHGGYLRGPKLIN